MNFREATEKINAYKFLEGREFRGKVVSTLLIAPLKEVGIPKLMYNYAHQISSAKFYEGYEEFEIWVIFDLEEWLLTGVLDKILLSKFIALYPEL